MTFRNISPNLVGSQQSDAYTPDNNPSEAGQLVEAIIFREKADIVYDSAIAASRQRVEYPTLHAALMKNFPNWIPDTQMPLGSVAK